MRRIFFLFCVNTFLISASQGQGALKLWYDKPAVAWEEALPLGNGPLRCNDLW